jgi:hypothetical protein
MAAADVAPPLGVQPPPGGGGGNGGDVLLQVYVSDVRAAKTDIADARAALAAAKAMVAGPARTTALEDARARTSRASSELSRASEAHKYAREARRYRLASDELQVWEYVDARGKANPRHRPGRVMVRPARPAPVVGEEVAATAAALREINAAIEALDAEVRRLEPMYGLAGLRDAAPAAEALGEWRRSKNQAFIEARDAFLGGVAADGASYDNHGYRRCPDARARGAKTP